MTLSPISKSLALVTYILGTLLMAFGWLCAMAQGDATQKAPRITGVVVVLVLALASLVPAAVRLWQTRHLIQMVLLGVVGIQAIACLCAIAAEFML